MTHEINRRTFVQQSVLASAGAALAVRTALQPATARAEDAPAQPTATAAMPRGKIADLEISRMLLGGNLLTHYTHSRDLKYVYSLAKKYNTDEKILETLAVAEENGINTVVVHNVRSTIALLQKHRQRGGKMQWITCTFHALAGGDLARFNREIEELVDAGTDALYISGVEADVLCGFKNDISATNSAERTEEPKLELLAQALDMAKAHGLPTGLGAHRFGRHPGLRKGRTRYRFLPEDAPPSQLSDGRDPLRFELLPGSRRGHPLHAEREEALDRLQGHGGRRDSSERRVRVCLCGRRGLRAVRHVRL